MYEFFMTLSHALPAYRAAQDSGSWILSLHAEQMQNFVESWLVTRGWA